MPSARGIAVVATPFSHPDRVQPEKNGLLVSVGDLKTPVATTSRLLDDADLPIGQAVSHFATTRSASRSRPICGAVAMS